MANQSNNLAVFLPVNEAQLLLGIVSSEAFLAMVTEMGDDTTDAQVKNRIRAFVRIEQALENAIARGERSGL